MTGWWDFLVVGAGSAGAAAAARLSEEENAAVLLLEAGPDWGADGGLPARLRSATGLFNWDAYTLMPDYYWQGLQARPTPVRPAARYLRGRGGGGSSTVNGCYAIRPPLEEFDDWAALGARGWSGADVLPYLIRLEDDRDFGDHPGHGVGGPIPVRRLPREGWGTVDELFAEAMQEAGHPWAPDHNAPGAFGVSPFAANIIDGHRVTSYDGYLTPAAGRKNLTIRGGAHVDRVLLEGGRARGVRVHLDGQWQEIAADRVVLSAGDPAYAGHPAALRHRPPPGSRRRGHRPARRPARRGIGPGPQRGPVATGAVRARPAVGGGPAIERRHPVDVGTSRHGRRRPARRRDQRATGSRPARGAAALAARRARPGVLPRAGRCDLRRPVPHPVGGAEPAVR